MLALVARRAETEQPLDLCRLVGGVEVEMHPAHVAERRQAVFGDAVERDVRAHSGRVGEYHPAVPRRLARDVAERGLPEGEHLVEPHAADDDRADPHLHPGVTRSGKSPAHSPSVPGPSREDRLTPGQSACGRSPGPTETVAHEAASDQAGVRPTSREDVLRAPA